MKKVPEAEDTILVWPGWPTLKEQQHIRDLSKERPRKKEERQSPEQMVRSLQAVFCRGRYRYGHYLERKPRSNRRGTGKKTV